MIIEAVKAGVLTDDERSGFHDLKRAGVTRTVGTQVDKMDASGPRSPAMLDVYDQSRPRVRPTED